MNNFIVNLRSNDSIDKFPDNVVSDFCVKMSNPIELKGQWQVGLSEIHYTNSIQGMDLELYYSLEIEYRNVDHSPISNIINDTTEFNTIKSLYNRALNNNYISEIVVKINRDSNFIDVTRDESNNIIRITLKSNEAIFNYLEKRKTRNRKKNTESENENALMNPSQQKYIRIKTLSLSNHLRFVLGMEFMEYENVAVIKGLKTPYYPSHPTSLFIHSDIIEHQYVGSDMLQLLRSVAMDRSAKNKNNRLQVIFSNPYFMNVNRNYIESIRIQILDEFMERIKFESGNVNVTLIFRKKPFI